MHIKAVCLTTVALLFAAPVTGEDWRFGVGTGFSYLAFSGDGGFQTVNGPTDFKARSKPNETREITESARGIIGFAEYDRWTINYLAGELVLQDDVSVQRGTDTGDFDIAYKRGGAEMLVDYTFSDIDRSSWSVTGGVRYTSVKYDGEINLNGELAFDDSAEEDWTDAVLGVQYTYAISPTTTWATRTNFSFGESEGSSQLSTQVIWQAFEHWEFRTFLDLRKTDFEQGDPDDSDYFLFDAEEIRFGGLALYVF